MIGRLLWFLVCRVYGVPSIDVAMLDAIDLVIVEEGQRHG